MEHESRGQACAAPRLPVPGFCEHVLWSFGTGNPGGGDGELFGPHSAEENPLNPDEIAVSEQFGCDVLLINRNTGQLRVLYGERGVSGGGKHLCSCHSAHFMPSGPYDGHVLITEHGGENRVMIIHRETCDVLWCDTDIESPLEAIYWDDDHIMVSGHDSVFKIRLTNRDKTWRHDPDPTGRPFYMQRLSKGSPASYGGDLLVGFFGPYPVVREIDTESGETVWTYGGGGEQGCGDLYDRLYCPVRALRYGIQHIGAGLTIICDERARILCVDQAKVLIWELGGASGENLMTATPYIVQPTYIDVTRRGTLLITDWGRNMIYEINPFCIPPRAEKDGYLFRDYETTDEFVDSSIMESRGYRDKNIQAYNTHETAGLRWRLLGSHDTRHWQVIYAPPAALESRQGEHTVITAPWNFLKAQASSASNGTPSSLNVFITMRR